MPIKILTLEHTMAVPPSIERNAERRRCPYCAPALHPVLECPASWRPSMSRRAQAKLHHRHGARGAPRGDLNQGGDVLLKRRLETDLAPAALIITQLKIWRAGHHALDGLITQWNSSRIARAIIGSPPAVRARVLKAPGAFSAPCGRRGACAKTPASDFVTRRDSFAGAARWAPQSVGLGEGRRLLEMEEEPG
jgi:hypothetical protein